MSKEEDTYLLLDSKLITRTEKPKIYNYKLVQCGEYIQLYVYQNTKVKRPNKNDYDDLELKKINFEEQTTKVKAIKLKETNEIEMRNIIRSKLQCQRIAKANMKDWKTFITLTFEDNIQDVNIANKKFQNFVRMIKKHYKNFMYLAVPEFQKRGAIHYHLFTNIDISNKDIIYEQIDNKKYKHIKYWNYGFNNVEPIVDDPVKVIGYISKYMTKDVDNRLFGYRRFFYSQNCITPKVSFIDNEDTKELQFLQKKIQDKLLIYQNEYLNTYDDSKVIFQEYYPCTNSLQQETEKIKC